MKFCFHSKAVWPPPMLVTLFVLIYLVLEGGMWFLEFHLPNGREVISDMPELAVLRAIILGAAGGCYALFRLGRFHPACQPGYAAWLKMSPWTSDRPLPLGPMHPVWQDFVVLGILTAVAKWYAHIWPFWPIVTFGMVWLIGMTVLLAITRAWPSCIALGFLWPAMSLPIMRGWPMGLVLALMLVVIWQGHQASLKRFPWEWLMNPQRPNASGILGMQIELRIPGLTIANPLNMRNAGWPYAALAPKIQFGTVSSVAAFWWSLLTSWWVYCLVTAAEIEALPGLILFFAIVGAGIRLLIYCSSVRAPFNLWGRISSGRLIIPAFDQVFLTPLGTIGAAIIGAIIIRRCISWHPIAEAVTTGGIWFVLLTGGPTLRNWLLTGQHRYRTPTLLSANKQVLRPV